MDFGKTGLRHTPGAPEVYGFDFPGETFRVPKQ